MTNAVVFALLAVPVAAALSDLFSGRVPKPFLATGFLFRAVLFFFTGEGLRSLLFAGIGSAAVLVTLLAASLLSDRLFGKKTLGGGDLWFIALLTFSFPFPTVLTGLFAGLLLGGLVLIRRKVPERKERTIPLTPYLLVGVEAAILIGG